MEKIRLAYFDMVLILTELDLCVEVKIQTIYGIFMCHLSW